MEANKNKNKNMDLDAPLLSTRRFSTEPPSSSSSSSSPFTSNFSSTSKNPAHRRSSLPFYKPDLKSGPVRNPGVVPFVWEQKPGQPKPGTDTNSPSRPPVAVPKPPPAKLGSSVRTRKPVMDYANSVKEAIDPSIENFYQATDERLKEESEVQKDGKFNWHYRIVPEEIQATSMRTTSKEESKEREKANKKLKEQKGKEQSQKETEQQKVKQKEKSPEEQSEEAESEEDNFSDALDTLSRTESLFINCSISGLSELQHGPTNQNNSPNGSDLETRGFMMDRFLPAAQAVATSSPQFTFRKVPLPGREPPKPPFTGTGMSPDQRRVPVPLPYQNQPKYEDNFEKENNEDEDEGEDEDDEDDEEDLEASRRFHAKGCGFLPSFCVKSSFLLMNPVPGLKGKGRAVRLQGGITRRNGSPLIRSSNNGPITKNSDDSFENYMHSWEPVYKHKQDQTNNYQNKPKETNKKNSDTSLLTYWSDSPNTRDGSSPLLHSTASNGEDQASKPASPPFNDSNRSNFIVPSLHSSRNGSGSQDKDPDPDPETFLDAQDSNRSEEEVKKIGCNVLPLDLDLPRSPSESWLSKTLPSVNVKKQPVTSFLGMQNKKQGEDRWRA